MRCRPFLAVKWLYYIWVNITRPTTQKWLYFLQHVLAHKTHRVEKHFSAAASLFSVFSMPHHPACLHVLCAPSAFAPEQFLKSSPTSACCCLEEKKLNSFEEEGPTDLLPLFEYLGQYCHCYFDFKLTFCCSNRVGL
jgi:hypothetical protein